MSRGEWHDINDQGNLLSRRTTRITLMKFLAKDYLIPFGKPLDLSSRPTEVTPYYTSKNHYQEILDKHIRELGIQQDLLYASAEYSLLLIIQGMDAAGKDGLIKHIMSGVNPQGCEVHSFKQPSTEELAHDFLWRTTKQLPGRGRIGIFNRSYYEDVLVVKVHPNFLASSGLPQQLLNEKTLWKKRYQSIVSMEDHLVNNGTRIVKIFLHLSKDEQKKRFRDRIEKTEKNWKFSQADIEERKYWNEYQEAFETCLSATSTKMAPWYVIPADDKRNARIIVSKIVVFHYSSK
jgi:PPK2 family polyphosphate:nucleotide phosphotransferase